MKKRKIAIIITLVLMIVMCHSNFAFAETNAVLVQNNSQLKILSSEQNENEQHLVVSENGIVTDINTKITENTVQTTMQNKETGEVSYFTVDKARNTLYSSITGKTIDISEEIQNIKQVYSDVEANKPPATKALKISYYKIYNALDKAATVTMIATLLLTFFTAAVTIPVLTTVAQLISSFSSILSMIANKMKDSKNISKDHGVKVGAKRVTYKKHQGGKTFYYYKYKISSLTSY